MSAGDTSDYRWPFRVRRNLIERRKGDAPWTHVLDVDVVPTFEETIVPPAGEEFAFTIQHWKRSIQIYVSPTGRSVQVWVDNKRIEFDPTAVDSSTNPTPETPDA